MRQDAWHYACLLQLMRPDIDKALPAAVAQDGLPKTTAGPDGVFLETCGLIPVFPEAYATAEARDARLGTFHGMVQFVPTTYAAVKQAAFATHEVAIGHPFGDAGFEVVAAVVLAAVADRIEATGAIVTVVVDRIRYWIGPGANEISARAVFGSNTPSEESIPTGAWVTSEVHRLLDARRNLGSPAAPMCKLGCSSPRAPELRAD